MSIRMPSKLELDLLIGIERSWLDVTPKNEVAWDWQPLSIGLYREMLDAVETALHESPLGHTPRFLEAGCGPGTKMWIAERYYGWKAYGFDSVPEYVRAAQKLDLHARIDRCQTFREYGEFDIVYISRPFKDDSTECAYESMVQETMKPGAFLVAAWAALKPKWPVYARGPYRGVWRKPATGSGNA